MDLCQTHCKQVPDFSRPSGSCQITWVDFKQVNTHGFPPVPTCGSIWVVLWPLFFRSAPSTFPLQQITLRGVCFRESLVYRLYSEIDQIHLSIEAQCGIAGLPMGDCAKPIDLMYKCRELNGKNKKTYQPPDRPVRLLLCQMKVLRKFWTSQRSCFDAWQPHDTLDNLIICMEAL